MRSLSPPYRQRWLEGGQHPLGFDPTRGLWGMPRRRQCSSGTLLLPPGLVLPKRGSLPSPTSARSDDRGTRRNCAALHSFSIAAPLHPQSCSLPTHGQTLVELFVLSGRSEWNSLTVRAKSSSRQAPRMDTAPRRRSRCPSQRLAGACFPLGRFRHGLLLFVFSSRPMVAALAVRTLRPRPRKFS